MIQPWKEDSFIISSGDTITGSFRGFSVLTDATFSAVTTNNIYNKNRVLITALPPMSAGANFFGGITSITLSGGSIQLW